MDQLPSPPPPQPDTLRTIFLNERGLRAGWRLLIFLAVLAGLFFIQGTIFFVTGWLKYIHIDPHQPVFPGNILWADLPQLLVVLAATWLMGRIERRPFSVYGLSPKSALKRFAQGALLWGILPLTLLLFVLHILHAFDFGTLQLQGGGVILSWAVRWFIAFLAVGLFEENLTRGYLQFTLADGLGFWPAAIITSALFALLHTANPGETPIGILDTFFYAVFACITLRFTGSLWLVIGQHAAWDWAQSFLFGVPDSGLQVQGHLLNPTISGPAWLNGGTAGPEGSILSMCLEIVLAILFVALYRRKPALIVSIADKKTPERF